MSSRLAPPLPSSALPNPVISLVSSMFIVQLKLKMVGNGVEPQSWTNCESKLLASFQWQGLLGALCASYLINPLGDPAPPALLY